MNIQRIVGIVIVVIGVILFIVGMNSSESVVDQVSETFTGRFTKDTIWYIVGGVGLTVLGLLMTVFSGRKARA